MNRRTHLFGSKIPSEIIASALNQHSHADTPMATLSDTKRMTKQTGAR
jgi:hypothetical protein